MKKLIIIRHCKSSWSDLSLNDFDRSLNNRGVQDGNLMSKELSKKIDNIDLLISSSSKRTRLTADFFIELIKINKISFIDELYHSSSENIINILKKISNTYESIMVIGHNPGLTDLVNKLTSINLYNLPTCGVAIVNLNIENWDIIKNFSDYDLEWIKFPKQLKL
tara:strand:- start:3965 stop:4459 length:495 start_codon:yes stop_codon:yes gene_type:complete